MVRDRQIIKKRFPIHARWFTGKIFVSVGDFDDGNNAFEYVLEFNIKDGNVRSTTFHESLKIPMTRNGLPDARAPDEDGTFRGRVSRACARRGDGGPADGAVVECQVLSANLKHTFCIGDGYEACCACKSLPYVYRHRGV